MLKSPTARCMLCIYVSLDLAFSVALSTVPTVTNVSLTCHNFKNVLSWNYSAPDPKPEFSIIIKGYISGIKSVRTSQTYLDLSNYTDAGDSYYISVEARSKGSELNASSEAILFSYNEDFNADITCMMDFPELKVSVLKDRVRLSFTHPYQVYNVESLADEFLYTVSYNKTEKKYDCYEDEEMCEAEFQLSESLYGNCLNVYIEGSVSGIPAKTDRKVCDHVPPNNTDWTMLLTILLCSVFGLLLLIIWGVIIYKKLTQPDSQSTLSKLLGIVKSDHINVPEQAEVSEVISIGQTPLLESNSPTFSDTPIFKSEDNSHVHTHFNPDERLLEEQDREGPEEEESGDFDSGNSFSGYDSQKFPMDMGQGDIVEAYGPR